MTPLLRRCPAPPTPVRGLACPERPACPADPAAVLPRDGAERAVMLALRFVAAAAETGDAACFDAAFDGAEAAFGPRDGALLVARAAALVRALRREGDGLRFLPPPCRHLSPGEAALLAALRLSDGAWAGPRTLARFHEGLGQDRADGPARSCAGPSGGRAASGDLSGAALAALADLAAPVRSVAFGLAAPPHRAGSPAAGGSPASFKTPVSTRSHLP